MEPFKTKEEFAKFLEKVETEHNKRGLNQVNLTLLTQKSGEHE